MKLKYRYVFRNDEKYSKRILVYLAKNNIKHENDRDTSLVVIEFLDDDLFSEELLKLFNKYKIKVNDITRLYTSEELNIAKWLVVRCKYKVGYPQPENNYYNITYGRNELCNECLYGLSQNDVFYINREPKWKKERNFYQLNWIFDELFVSNEVIRIFDDNNIKGIQYLPVKKYKKNEIIDGVKQIKINHTLDKGLIENENIEISKICNRCGRKRYLVQKGAIISFNKEIFNNNYDIVQTYEYFGEILTGKIILVSNKVYKVIKDNKLDKNLIFEPINLI